MEFHRVMRTHYLITEQPLGLEAVAARVADPAAGAVAVFVGTARNAMDGKVVRHLEYEAYQPMAERVLAEIGTEIAVQWPEVVGVAIAHRVGRVQIGAASVILAVSAPHRRDALAACAWGIDRLKAVLPVWKLETFADGTVWRENRVDNVVEEVSGPDSGELPRPADSGRPGVPRPGAGA
ncbi:MAG: molybdenum cofactor biosynthesis protein MoaE [Gemmatimonadota bacterium]